MRRPWWPILFLAGFACPLVLAGPEADELARNRRLLDKWKADPDHRRRLEADFKAFYALPAERQEQLRDLDRQLHDADPMTQSRLWAAMERYSKWLTQRDEAERKAIDEAEDALTVVRALRQREWLSRLPAAVRAELAALPPEQQLSRVEHYRQVEQGQRFAWQQPANWDGKAMQRPTKLADLPRPTQAFVEKELLPRLKESERASLREAEGKWPQFAKQIATLSDRYPVLPEGPLGKVASPGDLPTAVKERLDRNKKGKALLRVEGGRWPDYALAVSEALRLEWHEPVEPLGASRPHEFPPATRDFIKNRLVPSLSPFEKPMLALKEGRWPDYPRTVLWLAKKHRMEVPGMSLPGPQEVWDAARFARHEYSPDERKAFNAFAASPARDLGDHLKKLITTPKKGGGMKGGGFGGKGPMHK